MSIQLTYLNRAFHGLSIDMSHDHKHVFLIFGVVTPPPWGITTKNIEEKICFRSCDISIESQYKVLSKYAD